MRLSRARLRRLRALRCHPRAIAHSRGCARAQLPGRREKPARLGVAGRSGKSRSVIDRRFPLSRRQGDLAEQARHVSDQRQLHADGRQSDGPDASRLSARQDGRRQPVGACRRGDEDDPHADGAQIHAMDEKLGAPAELCQGSGISGPRRSLPDLRVRRAEHGPAMDRRGRCRQRIRRPAARFPVPVPAVSRADAGDRDELLLLLVCRERVSPE